MKLLWSLLCILGSTAFSTGAVAGGWKYVEEQDPVTDKRKQFLYGTPISANGAGSDQFIRIGCYEPGDGMGVTLAWGTPVTPLYPEGQIDMAAVTVRFDKDEARTLGWAASKSYEFTYPPGTAAGAISQLGEGLFSAILPGRTPINSTWTAKQLHFSMLAAEKAIFRAAALRGPEMTLVFDMSGYIDEAKNFDAACNPSGINEIDPKRASPEEGNAYTGKTFYSAPWADISKIRKVFESVSYADGKYPIVATTKIEAIELPWRDGSYLVRASDADWARENLRLYFLIDPRMRPIWLDGTVAPIRSFLSKDKIKLSGAGAADFARFFFFFVRGEGGPFLIVESESDPFFPKGNMSPETKQKMDVVVSKLKPLKCEVRPNEAICKALVYYTDSLFEATFKIQDDGNIEMTDDLPIVSDLPLKVDAPIR